MYSISFFMKLPQPVTDDASYVNIVINFFAVTPLIVLYNEKRISRDITKIYNGRSIKYAYK